MVRLAKRVTDMPPYLFAQIDEAAKRARSRGLAIVHMGIGDPDQDPPEWIRRILAEEVMRSGNHRYPSYKGHPQLLEAALEYLARRFGIKGLNLDHVCTTIGSKEGLANLAPAVLNHGDTFIAPDPSYPVFATLAKQIGALEVSLPLTAENNFAPDPADELTEYQLQSARVIYLNYPHNPSGCAPNKAYLQKVIDCAHTYDLIVVSDLAYAEIYYGAEPPASLLQLDGALDCVIEFHSFSKSFNMTGWRCGFAAGQPELIRGLTQIKTNIDSGVFNAIQLAMARVLTDPHCDEFLADNRLMYAKRLDRVLTVLDQLGLEFYRPGGAIYVWCRVPNGDRDSIAWASALLDATGLVIGPGRGYGVHGEGWFRLSLTTPDADIDRAMEMLAQFMRRK